MERDEWDITANILDTSGLQCPLPVLKLRKMIKTIEGGKIIKMLATDEASLQDVQAFCESNHHTLLAQYHEDDRLIHYVQKESDT